MSNNDTNRTPATARSKYQPGIKLDDIERVAIIEALEYHGGNRTKAAHDLGISRATMRNKIARYKVEGHKVPEPPKPLFEHLWRPKGDEPCLDRD